MNAEFEIIRRLETELCSNETRNDADRLTALLHDDFEEFGKSGRIFDKAAIIKEASTWSRFDTNLTEFRFTELSEVCILVKYQSCADRVTANRTSIWVHHQGRWQVLHHQGTQCD